MAIMQTTVCFALTAIIFVIVSGEELILRPSASSHVRAVGGSLMLTCQISEPSQTSTHNIAWYVESADGGRQITNTDGRVYVEKIDDTMIRMYITDIKKEDEALYYCQANSDEETWQLNVTLSLYKDITFENIVPHQHPRIYTDAIISCVVSGKPEPEVAWMFGGKRIPTVSDKYVQMAGEGLQIMNITQEDNGEYTCRAEVADDGRVKQERIIVTVYIPPMITKSSDTIEGVEGDHVQIVCEATGLPQPKYTFTKDGSTEPLASAGHVTVNDEAGTIVFSAVTKSDDGVYNCTATNEVDEDVASTSLVVHVRPFVYEFNSVVGNESVAVEMVCKSHGDTPLKMSFRKNGEDDIIQVNEEADGELNITLSDPKSSDSGEYICQSESKYGVHESTASLTVQFKPKIVDGEAPPVYTWADQRRNISCQASAVPAPVLSWMAKGEELVNNATFHIYDLGTISYLEVTVEEADQQWIYDTYTCKATNVLGTDEWSVELKRAAAPSEPQSVTAVRVGRTVVQLEVVEPEENGGIPITGYIVQFDFNENRFDVGADIILENLIPDTSYVFQVRAVNDVGSGNFVPVSVKTNPTSQPSTVDITSDREGSNPFEYLVQWKLADDGGLPVANITVKWRIAGNDNESSDWQIDSLFVNDVEHRITNLLQETTYELQVIACNSAGCAEPNQHFLFITSSDPDATTLPVPTPSTVKVQETESELNGRNPTLFAGITESVREAEMVESESGVLVDVTSSVRGHDVEEGHVESVASADVSFVSVGMVIGVIVVVLLVILVIIDVSCYFVNDCGVIMNICTRVRGQDTAAKKEKDLEHGEGEQMLKVHPENDATNTSVTVTEAAENKKKVLESPSSDTHDENKPLLAVSGKTVEVKTNEDEIEKEPLKPIATAETKKAEELSGDQNETTPLTNRSLELTSHQPTSV